jgi:hypothetical protein
MPPETRSDCREPLMEGSWRTLFNTVLESRCKPGVIGIGCLRFNIKVFEEVVRFLQVYYFSFARSTGAKMQGDYAVLPFGKRPIYIVR